MAKSVDTEETSALTFERLKKRKKARVKELSLLLDPEVGEERDAAKKALRDAEVRRSALKREGASLTQANKDVKAAEADLEAAEEALRDATAVFKFSSIGRIKMEELLEAHEPTEKQIQEAKAEGVTELQYNPSTFPQALIAASCIEPNLTEEQVEEIWDDESWNTNELVALFQVAQEVNQYVRTVDLGKGSGQTRG
jgi:multidrug efflux pump subunit AcrA (membrane-fusion protein)